MSVNCDPRTKPHIFKDRLGNWVLETTRKVWVAFDSFGQLVNYCRKFREYL